MEKSKLETYWELVAAIADQRYDGEFAVYRDGEGYRADFGFLVDKHARKKLEQHETPEDALKKLIINGHGMSNKSLKDVMGQS